MLIQIISQTGFDTSTQEKLESEYEFLSQCKYQHNIY